ncbi:hypothetical protein D9619_000360 [Psilocybe cf. subviscida]|uniref:Uncharacterized protein n=1 Tax=Psilocybe cf. subviscida TaxID=2480587 RepID=A0A8H5F2T3_9AGAR|nr:hypothetical protein D9619_000360 [Psilocybe cf. subviscida]
MSTSDSTTFGGTITGGIQDISALLPLLGTDQCEQHVGSALDRGYLYSSVTPISVFGSLGIVRASFNILVASFNVQRFQFLGAMALSDGGFIPSGTVAPIIAIDRGHPKRFVAETRLEAMLADEHIDNVADLTVSLGKDVVRWNFKLVFSTLFISLAGLSPYIKIIVNLDDANPKHFFPLGFGFPILRVFGSAVCVIVVQFLIQIRVITLLKTRLLFICINRLGKEAKIKDLAPVITAGQETNDTWASELPAEMCVWALQKWLATNPDAEERENHQKLLDIYSSQYEQHLGPMNTRIRPWITLFLCFILVAGCIATVVGYVGCFFLIQHSASSSGTLVWLGLEAVLSILRIIIWAANPSWDDSEGIVFELRLSTNPPLLTCNRTVEEMLYYRIGADLTRSILNLQEAVAFAGPLPSFSVPDVELYHIFAIHSQHDHSRRLLIVISSPKDQRNRLLVKEAVDQPFSIYAGTLYPFPGTSLIGLTVNGKRNPNSHFLTSHSVFMTEIETHYDKINFELQNQDSRVERRALFGKSWAMHPPLTKRTNNNQQPEKVQIGPPLLNQGDRAYLQYGLVERLRTAAYQEMDVWINNGMRIFSTGLALTQDTESTPADQAVDELSFFQKREASEKRYLLVACQRYLEFYLISMVAKWDKCVQTNHAKMVEIMQMAFMEKTSKLVRHSNVIRKHKLETRLSNELERYMQAEAERRRVHTQQRIDAHLTPLDLDHVTIPRSQETNPTIHENISSLKGLVFDTVDSPFWDANLAVSFNLPPDLAVQFNAASASEQTRMLVRFQKDVFLRDMENRFDLPYWKEHRVRSGMMDQVMSKCRIRANMLFEMLAFGANHLSDVMDLQGSQNYVDYSFNPDRLREILHELSEEWKKTIDRSEKVLERMGAGSREKSVVQTKLSRYFAKKLFPV